ncbi:hypothetical protein VKT23_001936 [Stygiomarasmius scandens]|uniref:Uncharacterized protein n=1 Tax=Marasmiellus scandens TaxID=2682957 RepID=A0ABR1K433_9AGAR
MISTQRSASPPPRAVSPDLPLLALPIRGLNPSRSCDSFPNSERVGRPTLRKSKSSKSIPKSLPSPLASSASSTALPSPTRRRYRSPPPSPAHVSSPPPPVPRIPEFLSQMDKKPVLRTPVMIPTPVPPPDALISPIQQMSPATPPAKSRTKKSPGRRSSVVMTCARFFMERNPSSASSACTV